VLPNESSSEQPMLLVTDCLAARPPNTSLSSASHLTLLAPVPRARWHPFIPTPHPCCSSPSCPIRPSASAAPRASVAAATVAAKAHCCAIMSTPLLFRYALPLPPCSHGRPFACHPHHSRPHSPLAARVTCAMHVVQGSFQQVSPKCKMLQGKEQLGVETLGEHKG
jgi:hypothetical protein